MEQTFMTIHNRLSTQPLTPGLTGLQLADLSHDANILFASESVVDILGYQPHEIHGKSCFDYFHPDEVPFARSVHNRGVLLDKAAVLHYARIASKDGRWVSCECCFTVVHNVLVACTSIYRRGKKSERRAIEAPHIRRIFSCSPRDPRYHMLEHLSPKFRMQPMEREPRAALILNRFTRTLSIMFATNAVSSILGVPPDQLQGKSLYECIAENCWGDAIKCLESAKANDSIAYLRFWSRDPRVREESEEREDDVEMETQEDTSSEKDPDRGVPLDDLVGPSMDDRPNNFVRREVAGSPQVNLPIITGQLHAQRGYHALLTNRAQREAQGRRRRYEPIPTRELEAVVSCTSDGLVMVLRRARPPIPLHPPMVSTDFENGLFAAPWGEHPVRPHYPPELFYDFQSPFLPQYMPVREHVKAAGGPPSDQLMKSIRDVAVFAWGLVGINGNLAFYSRGKPSGESQPPDGLPIWDPAAPETSHLGPEPPSSRYQEDISTKVYTGESVPPVHSIHTPNPTTEGGRGHTHTLGQFDSMHPSHSDSLTWPKSAITRPFQELILFPHVQQSQYGTL